MALKNTFTTLSELLAVFSHRELLEEAYETAYHREADGYHVMISGANSYEWRPGPHPTLVGEYLLAVVERVDYVRRVLTCEVVGHDWKDESHAGPESGTIAMSCNRCGECHSTILY